MVQFYNEYQNIASIWQRPVAELETEAIGKRAVSQLGSADQRIVMNTNDTETDE